MAFKEDILSHDRPARIRDVALPGGGQFFPSPVDWRNEVLYFLLPDRFSDGREATRPLLDRSNVAAARPAGFRFDRWAQSGGERWQGGTIAGVASKLDYLRGLGVTTIWVGPVFKQRGHLDTYHGYGIQDFLEIDPHFGTRRDLVDFVAAAHAKGLRVILDIVFNHSGHNWDYAGGQIAPPYRPFPGFYRKGPWVDASGAQVNAITSDDDGVFPEELQREDCYTRAGEGSLGGEDVDDDHAEFKRTDFAGSFRDFNLDDADALSDLARCYKYWITLTDCDGFRLDTLKHVPEEAGRNFCGTVKEFAARIGKENFFLMGEVGGPDRNADRYLDALELNLSATLNIGPMRNALREVAKGLAAPRSYFDIVAQWNPVLGSHSRSGPRHVSVLDDHDHVSGDKVRFSSDAASDHQVVAGVAIQLFTLGIPCVYYGTEQSFAGPEKSEREQFLPDYNVGNPPPDKYLREIMFGAEHPRQSGRAGLQPGDAGLDTGLPAFGAFGTVGHHCFDEGAPAYVRIKELIMARQERPALRYGRQYARQVSNFGGPFAEAEAGEVIAWSRVLDEEEVLCVVNGHGAENRGGDIVVDATLNAGGFLQVIANSAQAAVEAGGGTYTGAHPLGERLQVRVRGTTAHVEIRGVPPSEVILLTNRP